MNEVILLLEGNANDLLQIGSPDAQMSMKTTRLFKFDAYEDLNMDMDELVDISVTSTSAKANHPIFDKILNHRIRLTLEILD